MSWLEPLLHWLAVHTGTVGESGAYYGFWSGFGSDIGEVAIIGGLISLLRKHNCHDKGCWRIGRHLVDGTPRCNKHHLDARAAVAAPSPVQADTAGKLAQLSEDITGLAEAIRAALLPPSPPQPAAAERVMAKRRSAPKAAE